MAAVIVIVLAGGAAAVDGAAPAVGTGAPAPLTTAWQTADSTWAIIPMGIPNQPANTFWQVFRRPVGATRWSLVTPPGVADNGGLVASQGTGRLIAGVEPSQGLTFSPLAGTLDFGRSWVTGILPAALAHVPDALTVTPGGSVLALVRAGGGTVQAGSITLAGWRPTTTRGALSAIPGGRRCGISTLSALSTLGDSPFVGVRCTRPGILGLFTSLDGTWRLVPTNLPAPREPLAVLRLGDAGGTTFSLVRVGGRRPSLVALWLAGGAWSHSPPLALTAGERIEATSTGSGTMAVVLGTARHGPVVELVTVGGLWRAAPTPPKGTVVVTPDGAGGLGALAVSSATLTAWELAPGTSTWVRVQRTVVPLAYGSSQ